MIACAQIWRFPGYNTRKKITSRVWWSYQAEETKFIDQRSQCGLNLWRSGRSTEKVLENSRKDPLSLWLSTGLFMYNRKLLPSEKEPLEGEGTTISGNYSRLGIVCAPMDRVEEPPNTQASSRALRRITASVMTPNEHQIKGWPYPA